MKHFWNYMNQGPELSPSLFHIDSPILLSLVSLCPHIKYRGLKTSSIFSMMKLLSGTKIFTKLSFINAHSLLRIRETDEWKMPFNTPIGPWSICSCCLFWNAATVVSLQTRFPVFPGIYIDRSITKLRCKLNFACQTRCLLQYVCTPRSSILKSLRGLPVRWHFSVVCLCNLLDPVGQ